MNMTDVRTTEELNEFLRRADNFHDALIRECAVVARGFVDAEYRLYGDMEPFDVCVFLQTQASDTPGIEIAFDGVARFCLDQPFDLSPSGLIGQGGVRFSFTTSVGGEPQVIASAMRYRFLDRTCLGQRQLLTVRRSTE